MKLSISKQLWFLIGFLVVNVLGLGLYSRYTSQALFNQLNDVASVQLPAVREMTLIDMQHDAMKSTVLQALLGHYTKNIELVTEAEASYKEYTENFHSGIGKLNELRMHDATKKAIQDAIPEIDSYIKNAGIIIESVKSNKTDNLPDIEKKFYESFDSLETKLEVLGELIEKDAASIQLAGETSIQIITYATVISGILGLLIAISFTRYIVKTLFLYIDNIRKSGDEVAKVSETLNESSSSLAASSNETAAAIEEISASVEQISAVVKANDTNAKNAANTSKDTRTEIENGLSEVTKLVEKMVCIHESSTQMRAVTETIDEIAFQTNLLSLNAAVEAARAGEHGKSFAVVADGVRQLAQRCAESAKQINQLILNNQNLIDEGNQMSVTVQKSLNQVADKIRNVESINSEISSASHEQSTGVQQVSQAITGMDKASHQNATAAQNVSDAAVEMRSQAEALKQLMTELEDRVA